MLSLGNVAWGLGAHLLKARQHAVSALIVARSIDEFREQVIAKKGGKGKGRRPHSE